MRHDAAAVNGQPVARATRTRSGILQFRQSDTSSPTFVTGKRGLFVFLHELLSFMLVQELSVRDRSADFVEQLVRTVSGRPFVDVIPVETLTRYRNDVLDIIEIFPPRPSKFLNHDVFSRWDACIALQLRNPLTPTSRESLLMVFVCIQSKQLDVKTRRHEGQHVTYGTVHCSSIVPASW